MKLPLPGRPRAGGQGLLGRGEVLGPVLGVVADVSSDGVEGSVAVDYDIPVVPLPYFGPERSSGDVYLFCGIHLIVAQDSGDCHDSSLFSV